MKMHGWTLVSRASIVGANTMRGLVACLALAFPDLAHAQASGNSGDLPNIVIILADDMGFGDLGCQNPDSKIPTPRLDALAGEGMRFTDAHSPSSVCSPTRYGLLTGTYAWRTPMKRAVLWPWDEPLIGEHEQTLPGVLRDRGYDTACIGKWHLGWDWPTKDGRAINDTIPIAVWDDTRLEFSANIDFTKPVGGGPTARGFDYYFGDDVPNFPPYTYIENDQVLGRITTEMPPAPFLRAGPSVAGWDFTSVMPALAGKAAAYIRAAPGEGPFRKRADRPFFLYLPLTAPHTPIAPAGEFIGKSGAHRYGDFMVEVDWLVGEVLDALSETGQHEDTLVIFTSDNGSPARDGVDMNGALDSVLSYGHDPSHIYRGRKADIWEGGHRVPFVAAWPGQIPAGAKSEETICLTDLMATFAALAGASLDAGAARDSYNILPALLGQPREAPIREATVHHSSKGMFAIRQGKWKYIEGRGGGGYGTPPDESGPAGQLYDLEADPRESLNRVDEEPEVVAALTSLLDRYRNSGRSAPQHSTGN